MSRRHAGPAGNEAAALGLPKGGAPLSAAQLAALADRDGNVEILLESLPDDVTGSDLNSGLTICEMIIGRRELLSRLQWWREPCGGHRVAFRIAEPAGPTVTVSLSITNEYEMYDTIKSYVVHARVPAPPSALSGPEWDDWVYEQLFCAFTGTGRSIGDSWYTIHIDDSSEPDLIGRVIG